MPGILEGLTGTLQDNTTDDETRAESTPTMDGEPVPLFPDEERGPDSYKDSGGDDFAAG